MTAQDRYATARKAHADAMARHDTRLMNKTAASLRIATAQLLKAEREAKRSPRGFWSRLFDFVGWA